MTHIAFVTLFLGLTLGQRTLELTVKGPAHHVEIRVDDRVAGVIAQEPWRVTINFGSHLLPHRLAAIAMDAEGHELARAEQTVNMPRPPAEAQIVLDRDATGKPSTAQILWQSLDADKPKEVSLTLDGRQIALDAGLRADIAGTDATRPHIMRARAVSPQGVVAESEIAFGGGLETQSGSQLTAIPIRVSPPDATLTPSSLGGWLTIGDEAMRVVAVEEMPGDVIIVRHPMNTEALTRLEPGLRMARSPMRLDETGRNAIRHPKPQARYVWPTPSRTPTTTPTDLMPYTYPFEFSTADDFKVIVSRVSYEATTTRMRYADAVAVAGIRAAAARRPRAVVLVLGGFARDESLMTSEQVREYLRAIAVPLFVWTLGSPDAASGWGDVIDISSRNGFTRAFNALRDNLQSQRIVWVDGEHLPAEVTVSSAGKATIETLAAK